MAGLLYDDFLVMHELLRKTFRPVLSTDAAITKRFTRRRIICYVQFISITISSIMTHYVGVTPFVGDQEGDMFYRLFVRRFFGDNNTMVVLQLIVFYAVISIMTFGSIIQITMCMYSVIQINFQYHLLVDDLNNKLMFHQEDFRLIEDYSQQEKISKSLERCVEELLKIQAVATKFFRLQSPVILISGVSGGTTVLVLLYLLLGQNAPLSHVKMAGGVFVSEYMLVTFCHLGQEYSNASVEFYDKLCELPWYYWNTNNRKMLLMILTNTKELTISCFGLKELNHTFLLYDCGSLFLNGLMYDEFSKMQTLLRKSFRPVKSLDPAVQNRLRRRRFTCYLQVISISLLSAAVHYGALIPLFGEEKGDLLYRLIAKRFFPDNQTMVILQCIILYLLISFIFIGSVIIVTFFMHSCLHITFQYYLLVDDLNRKFVISEKDVSMIDDASYQDNIGKHLKQCIEELLKIQEVATKFLDLQSPIMLTDMVSGGVVVLGLVYLIMMGNAELSYVKMLGGILIAEYVLVTFCYLGQEYSNAVLCELCDALDYAHLSSLLLDNFQIRASSSA
nr:unnamed protein product [Callosobruchus chinensis]